MTRLRRLEHGVYEADGAGSGLLDMSDGLPPKETEDVPEYHIDGDMNITQIDLPKKTGSSDPTSELQPKQERVKKNRQSLPYYDLISVH